MTLTAIVIDDSSLQKIATSKLIKDNPNLTLIGSFSNPLIGLEAVNHLRPDVLFLDVEMPLLNGFQVLESIQHDCQVIMNSTREEFALQAFEYNHVKDYLTKPMKKQRFEKSVERAMKNQGATRPALTQYPIPVYNERLNEAC